MNAMHAMPVTPLLLGPLLASVRLDRGRTLLVCCCAAALGPVMGAGAGDLASARFGTEYGGLLLGCAIAAYLARHRTSLEAALAQAREVAHRTQQLILRPISRDLDGIHVCTRYHCAAAESAVGGDVYEAAATPYGLRVLVGDVRGHGLEALRLSAATVAAFRELAYTTPDLPALVTDLDQRPAPQLDRRTSSPPYWPSSRPARCAWSTAVVRGRFGSAGAPSCSNPWRPCRRWG
ncbi:PP2C family protein-serine/threonine phosphatase [Streptomyces sp. MAI_2237]